jgi:hypothetical protein
VSKPSGVEGVTTFINQLNRQAQAAANAARVPGSTALEGQSSNNISQELHGQVPADVIRLLGQQAAERGASTGMGPGSPNANSAYLQALGLTSLDLQKRGQADLSAADARNPGAPLFDPSTQLLTPYQSGSLGLHAQELADEANYRQQQLELQRQRQADDYALSQQRFARASGPQTTSSQGGLPGFGGEFVANSPVYSGPTLSLPTDPYSVSDWWNPSYSGNTGNGTGNFYAGPASGYQDPNAWMDQFYSEWDQGGAPGAGTQTATYPGLPSEDFVSNGFIGTDAGPVGG